MAGRTRDQQGIVEVSILAARGLDQRGIAGALRVSQPTVSKRLAEAKRLGYLTYPPPAPVLERKTIPDELLSAAEYSVQAGRLRDELLRVLRSIRTPATLRHVWIQRGPSRRTDSVAWLDRLNTVAVVAARRFAELLPDAKAVGLTWGYSISYFLRELQKCRAADCKGQVVVFPTVGSFPYEETIPLALESTTLARSLGELLNSQTTDDQLSLASIPAFIPKAFENDRATLLRFFVTFPAFKKVFGVPGESRRVRGKVDSLLERADTLLTGMGDMPAREGEGSPSLKARLMLEGAHLERWSKIVVGDIGGVLLPRRGISSSDREKVTEINRRFIGPGLEDFQACAQKATNSVNQYPGVIAIAHTKAKAAVVLEAIRLGCVTELFVDDELADELLHLIESDS
jgi:DNA-binding transcriptional regulator LsrR (DeoR family)